MGFGREITYHATGTRDPIMGVGGAHSPWHRMAHLLKLSKTMKWEAVLMEAGIEDYDRILAIRTMDRWLLYYAPQTLNYLKGLLNLRLLAPHLQSLTQKLKQRRIYISNKFPGI